MSAAPGRWTGVYTQMHRDITEDVDTALTAETEIDERVILVGPMGAGKSTVGTVLGQRLGLAQFDTDQLFKRVFGPISEYFAQHGEPAFRAAEEELVGEVLSHNEPFVLSLGGGSVLSAQTRSRLADRCFVVNLKVDEHTALSRLNGGVGRPVLAGDPVRNWLRILHERSGLYHEVAQHSIDTTGLDTEGVAAAIIQRLRT